MPFFSYRRELRKEHIDPTSMILLTIITVDQMTKEVRILGYSGI